MALDTVLSPRDAQHGPSAVTASTRSRRESIGYRRVSRWWQPGWPLTYLFTGYPLWWLLGLTQAFLLLATVIMAVQLVRRHRVSARAGFGVWLLFLAWVSVGILLLQVNAPDAQPGPSNGRYLTFVYRFCLYLAATIALLYVYNFRSRIPTQRITRACGWFFVTVVGGGVLGAVAPYLDFPSVLELLLPHQLTNVEFVHTLVHPGISQIANRANPTGTPRTSAPFAYTNDWGLSFACLMPFFLVSWFAPDAGWRRHAAPWILLIAVYPVVVSQNRGLWIALFVGGIVVCARSAVFGNIRFVIVAITGAAAALVLVLSTPLGATISKRLTNAGSETGRATLGTQTLRSVADRSPVVGLGTTRPVQGSFFSIAGGDSPDCVGCTPPPLGTQGHLWLVAFSTGYGGLALYLGFIVLQLFRHIRLRSPVATAGTVVLVTHLSTMLIYDTIGTQLVIIFVALGLLWREHAEATEGAGGRPAPDPTISGYLHLVQSGTALILFCAVLGAAGGLGYREFAGVDHEAVTLVEVPANPSAIADGGTAQTMDTLAQLIGASEVRTAVRTAIGRSLSVGGPELFVTAKANTRILQIHVVLKSAAAADRAGRAAGEGLVAARERLLTAERADSVTVLARQRSVLLSAVATVDELKARDPAAKPLTEQRNRLIAQIQVIDGRALRVETTRLDPGRVIESPPSSADTAAWLIDGISGLMLGVLVGVFIVWGSGLRGHRYTGKTDYYGRLPVVGRINHPSLEAVERAASALMMIRPVSVLSADGSQRTRVAASSLDQIVANYRRAAGEPRPAKGPVIGVVGSGTTDRDLEKLARNLVGCGSPLAGVVVLSACAPEATDSFAHRILCYLFIRPPGKRK